MTLFRSNGNACNGHVHSLHSNGYHRYIAVASGQYQSNNSSNNHIDSKVPPSRMIHDIRSLSVGSFGTLFIYNTSARRLLRFKTPLKRMQI